MWSRESYIEPRHAPFLPGLGPFVMSRRWKLLQTSEILERTANAYFFPTDASTGRACPSKYVADSARQIPSRGRYEKKTCAAKAHKQRGETASTRQDDTHDETTDRTQIGSFTVN